MSIANILSVNVNKVEEAKSAEQKESCMKLFGPNKLNWMLSHEDHKSETRRLSWI